MLFDGQLLLRFCRKRIKSSLNPEADAVEVLFPGQVRK
jgi:hypothetical protein